MKISYSDWWDDIVALARANASILLAIAGAFVFLPAMAASFVTTPFVPPPADAALREIVQAYLDYYSANWLPLLVVGLLSALGQLLLYVVLLDKRRPRVGEAFGIAAGLFLTFFVTSILVRLLVAGGLLLFIVPALYLIGRLLLSGAVVAAEGRRNPLGAIARSFALTQAQGWRIFFFAFLVLLVALVIQLALGGTLGAVVKLAAGGGGGRFGLGALLLAALEAAFASLYFLLGIALATALYRRLATGTASPSGT